jgi:hypothetical protein
MIALNIVGNTPEPDQLYGRDELIGRIWRQLAGNNILLLGPRRFGKSGVMRHLLRRPRTGYLPLYLDLMDASSPVDFAMRLTEAAAGTDPIRKTLRAVKSLPKALREFLVHTVEEMEVKGVRLVLRQELETSWRETVRHLGAEMEKCQDTVVFLLDEFPWMLANMEKKLGPTPARDFMAWFSSFRLRGDSALRRHRFVVAGSIGLDALLRRLEAPDKLRDFERAYAGAIDEATAVHLVRDVCQTLDIEMTDELRQQIVERMDRIPYFIHLLLSMLAQLPDCDRHPVVPEGLERVCADRMLGNEGKGYFDHYRDRLRHYGKSRERAAMAILSTVSEAPSGRVGESALYDMYRRARGRGFGSTEFDELMADLQCDFYLARDSQTNEYRFLVSVMRNWWKQWYPLSTRRHSAKRP